MSQLEQIVRPFETPDASPPIRVLTPGQAAHPPVILTVQLKGQVETQMGQYTITVTRYCTKHVVEKSTPTG